VERLPAEAEAIHRARPHVLDQHVGALHQIEEHRAPTLGFQIQRDALLAGVEQQEEPRVLAPLADAEIRKWFAAAGLELATPVRLEGDPLTVVIWSGRRSGAVEQLPSRKLSESDVA
jgi:hypothetical protein